MHLLETCSADGTLIRTQRLDPTRAYALGRSPRCDLRLPVGSVSRRHAAIFCHAGVWRIVDTGSRRGLVIRTDDRAAAPSGRTFHGSRGLDTPDASIAPGHHVVRQAILRPDQLVGVGPAWLRLGRDPASTHRNGNGAKGAGHEQWRGAHDMSARTVELPAITETELRVDAPSVPELLIVETAGHTLGVYDLRHVDHATIGTDPLCRIALPSRPGLLPLHAVLLHESKAWSIIDAGGGVQSDGARYLRRRLRPDVSADLGSVRVRIVTVVAVKAKDESQVEPPSLTPISSGISAFLTPTRDANGHMRLVEEPD
jgi:hypothetical protein